MQVLSRLYGQNWIAGMLMYGAGEGKGGKDRVTILPLAVEDRLKLHLEEVKARHEKDLSETGGYVKLPGRLEKKYPDADRQWTWQWVFSATKQFKDPATGCLNLSHVTAFFCYSPAGGRVRHSNHSRVAGAQRRQYDDDLHARPQPRRKMCAEPPGFPEVVYSGLRKTS